MVGKLTDDDLERVGGKADQIIGLLQQKDGYTKEHAEEEFSWRLEATKLTKAVSIHTDSVADTGYACISNTHKESPR